MTMSTRKNIHSFLAAGIWPINSMIFNDYDFLESFAIDRPNTAIANGLVPAVIDIDRTLCHTTTPEYQNKDEKPGSPTVSYRQQNITTSHTRVIHSSNNEVINIVKSILNDVFNKAIKS